MFYWNMAYLMTPIPVKDAIDIHCMHFLNVPFSQSTQNISVQIMLDEKEDVM